MKFLQRENSPPVAKNPTNFFNFVKFAYATVDVPKTGVRSGNIF